MAPTIDQNGTLHDESGRFAGSAASAPSSNLTAIPPRGPVFPAGVVPPKDLADNVNGFIEAWAEYDGDNVPWLLMQWSPRLGPIDPDELAAAYEDYDGDLDAFVDAWASLEVCPETRGAHDVSDGSCDACGGKNFG